MLLSSLALVFAVAASGSLEAQDVRFPADKMERATSVDESGKVEWAEHVEMKCSACSGTGKVKCTTCERLLDDAPTCIDCQRTKEAVCRMCCGLGYWPDPLEKVLCPACCGAAFILCDLCSGGGRIRGSEDGDRFSKCPACRGDGGWKCETCKGERLVETVPLKPSLKEASAANLRKAIAATDVAIQSVSGFKLDSETGSRKAVKDLVKRIKEGEKVFPVLKRAQKTIEDALNKTYAGNAWQHQGEREAKILQEAQFSVEYFLKAEKRIMEQALQRAETNEKLAADAGK
jgi:hypothetical protein